VHGLNLTVPENAKETIKPWDERESTEKFAESNVDDQVRDNNLMINPLLWLIFGFSCIADRTHPIRAKCPIKVRIAEARCVVPIALVFFLCAGFEIT
jgi:hypothetical protein